MQHLEQRLGIVQLLAVGCIRFQQVLDTVALTFGLTNLFLRGGYLLADVRALVRYGTRAGLQLQFLEVELHGVHQPHILTGSQLHAFLHVHAEQFARSLGRHNDLGRLEGTRSVVTVAVARTGGQSQKKKNCCKGFHIKWLMVNDQ